MGRTDGRNGRDRRSSLVRTFEAICERGPLARSELRSSLGTSPSTITLSVQTLRERGLVVEGEVGGPTGGRRPRIIDLGPAAGGVVAVDIGGFNLRVAAANLRSEILSREEIRTPMSSDPERFEGAIGSAIEVVRRSIDGPIRAIGVGVAGIVDPVTGRVSGVDNVPGWHRGALEGRLAELGAPVFYENEADLGALGEQRAGGARDAKDVLFVALGAGIGAGVIIGGELFRGFAGAAGEIGYMRISDDLSLTFEQTAGAGAVVRGFRSRGGAGTVSSAEEVFALARSGDRVATETVDELIDRLAAGIANAIVLLNPETVVLGGGLAEAGEFLVAPLRRRIDALVPARPDLRLSALGADAALVGAVRLAAQRAIEDIGSGLENSSTA